MSIAGILGAVDAEMIYHTQADTIEKLDFDFLAKICKTISRMAIDLPSTINQSNRRGWESK